MGFTAAPSQGFHPYGIDFQIETVPGKGDFPTVGELIKINRTGRQRKQFRLTNLHSPGKVEEFGNGFLNQGKWQFDVNLTQAQYAQLDSQHNAGLTYTARLVWPLLPGQSHPTTWQGQVNIEEMGEDYPEDDRTSMPITVQITGVPTLTAGS